MDTFTAPADITRHWYIVDATDRPLGRLASDIPAFGGTLDLQRRLFLANR